MLYSVESKKDIESTALALEGALKKRMVGGFQVHNLREELARNGVDLKKECRIYKFSQCEELKLPLTISLFTEADRVKIAALKASDFMGDSPQPEIQEIVNRFEKELMEVMEEASK
ncbi:MAG: hypothetical protein PHR44_04525 [Candidatus Omnitrophica bacterium]|nr:hypothetical protein [Candidatus Omnitrophota bacterium]